VTHYANAAAFKQAVEVRLRTASTSGHDFERRRQLLVFDRFLARLTSELGDAMILKGGLVVELRVERARTTQDVDLRLTGAPSELITRLRRAAELELGDSMVFTVTPDTDHPQITNEGMIYEGQRYRVACTLAGKPYRLRTGDFRRPHGDRQRQPPGRKLDYARRSPSVLLLDEFDPIARLSRWSRCIRDTCPNQMRDLYDRIVRAHANVLVPLKPQIRIPIRTGS
jgi:hypothetical protein